MEEVSAAAGFVPEKKKSFLLYAWRFFKWSFIIASFLLILAVSLVFIFEDDIKDLAITELNKHLAAEVKIDPQNIDLTILKTFPDAGIEFKNAAVMEALQKKDRDTIIDAGKISLRFNVMDLFNGKYDIKKIIISDTKIDFLTDKNGRHNFIFWKESKDGPKGSGEKEINFQLEKIEFENVDFLYRNKKEFIKAAGKTQYTSFSGAFSASEYQMQSSGKISFSDLILYKRSLLRNKNVSFEANANVKGKDWELKETSIAINQLNLYAKGGVWKKDSIISCDLDLSGKDLDVKSALSILPESQQEKIKDYDSKGEFYFNAKLKGSLEDFNALAANIGFGVHNAEIKHAPSGSVLSNVNLTGKYSKTENGKDNLSLTNINARMNSNVIEGECKLNDLADPFLELNTKINAELSDLIRFYPVDTIQSISGKVRLHAQIAGRISDLKKNYADQKTQAKGDASIENLQLQFKHAIKPIKIKTGQLAIVQNDLSLNEVVISPDENDIVLNGELNNFFAWLLKENEPLNIRGNAKANEIKIDQFLTMFSGPPSQAQTSASSTSSSNSAINISDKFILNFGVEVGKASWDKFSAEDIKGNVRIKEGKIFADDLNFKSFDGDVSFTGFAAAEGDKIIFKGSSELVGVNVNKMFTQMNNFSQDVIQDKHVRGIATVSIGFKTAFDQNFSPSLGDIEVISDILIERGELIDYKPLEALSEYVELAELKRIKFNTLKSHVEIKNQVVTIGKTEINNTAMNISLSGTHTFNNDIDYHISLLMSELMAKKPGKNKQLDEELRLVETDPENKRTVFIRMTGNIDNIKIKYDRKAAKEKLKDDIKSEKKNLKVILNEEFGLFRKDSTLKKDDSDKRKKSDQKFIIQTNNINAKQDDKKKKEDDDEDF